MKIIKLFWILVFTVFLSACGFLSGDQEVDPNAESSLYKTGQIVLKTTTNKSILVAQIPHPKEPLPGGVILFIMDKEWAEDGGRNKVWARMKSVLQGGGEDICRYDSAGKRDLTGATIVEFGEYAVQKIVIDQGIYSNNPELLGAEVHYVGFTGGVLTELSLSKGNSVFLAKGEVNSLKKLGMNVDDMLEYVDLVRASQRGGLRCVPEPLPSPVSADSFMDPPGPVPEEI